MQTNVYPSLLCGFRCDVSRFSHVLRRHLLSHFLLACSVDTPTPASARHSAWRWSEIWPRRRVGGFSCFFFSFHFLKRTTRAELKSKYSDRHLLTTMFLLRWPGTNTSYDRFCLRLPEKEVREKLAAGTPHVLRLKVCLKSCDLSLDGCGPRYLADQSGRRCRTGPQLSTTL